MTTEERIRHMKNVMKQRMEEKAKGKEEEKKNDEHRDYLVSGSRDYTIKIWEVKSGRCILTLTGHDSWVNDLAFHPSGKYLYSVSDDKTIRIWDLTNGRCYRRLGGAHENFISSIDAKGKVVVSGGFDFKVKVWNCR